jgi:hypothetical protein
MMIPAASMEIMQMHGVMLSADADFIFCDPCRLPAEQNCRSMMLTGFFVLVEFWAVLRQRIRGPLEKKPFQKGAGPFL